MGSTKELDNEKHFPSFQVTSNNFSVRSKKFLENFNCASLATQQFSQWIFLRMALPSTDHEAFCFQASMWREKRKLPLTGGRRCLRNFARNLSKKRFSSENFLWVSGANSTSPFYRLDGVKKIRRQSISWKKEEKMFTSCKPMWVEVAFHQVFLRSGKSLLPWTDSPFSISRKHEKLFVNNLKWNFYVAGFAWAVRCDGKNP